MIRRLQPAVDVDAVCREGKQIDEAAERAGRDARLRHRQLGVPLGRDGQVIGIPPEGIVVDPPEEKSEQGGDFMTGSLTELQKSVCRRCGARFEPPAAGSKIGIALQTLGRLPIHGVRVPPPQATCGWYIHAGEWSAPGIPNSPLSPLANAYA